jgi:hypothetical protein
VQMQMDKIGVRHADKLPLATASAQGGDVHKIFCSPCY